MGFSIRGEGLYPHPKCSLIGYLDPFGIGFRSRLQGAPCKSTKEECPPHWGGGFELFMDPGCLGLGPGHWKKHPAARAWLFRAITVQCFGRGLYHVNVLDSCPVNDEHGDTRTNQAIT